jgi:hypothetical protein
MPILENYTQRLYVPDRLWHGTTSRRLESIRVEGLRRDLPKESMFSQDAIYFACDPRVAVDIAKSTATRRGGEPVLLSVASDDLDGRHLILDINMPGGQYWSIAVAYDAIIRRHLIFVDDLSLYTDYDGVIPFNPTPEDLIAFDLEWERADEFRVSELSFRR